MYITVHVFTCVVNICIYTTHMIYQHVPPINNDCASLHIPPDYEYRLRFY